MTSGFPHIPRSAAYLAASYRGFPLLPYLVLRKHFQPEPEIPGRKLSFRLLWRTSHHNGTLPAVTEFTLALRQILVGPCVVSCLALHQGGESTTSDAQIWKVSAESRR